MTMSQNQAIFFTMGGMCMIDVVRSNFKAD